jgi:hypothetical protein
MPGPRADPHRVLSNVVAAVSESPRKAVRLSRRRLLVGAVAGASVVAGVNYGRYALGDDFENHVAGVFGISREAATVLLEGARERLGAEDYRLHATAFLSSTTFPGDAVLPAEAQRRAIERFVGNLVTTHIDQLVALGLQTPSAGPCRGMLRE